LVTEFTLFYINDYLGWTSFSCNKRNYSLRIVLQISEDGSAIRTHLLLLRFHFIKNSKKSADINFIIRV